MGPKINSKQKKFTSKNGDVSLLISKNKLEDVNIEKLEHFLNGFASLIEACLMDATLFTMFMVAIYSFGVETLSNIDEALKKKQNTK